MLALWLACAAPAPTGSPPSPAPSAAPVPELEAVAIPPDGKYEDVQVLGVTVPMVNLMDGGTVLLVDVDGAKPRTWEEQYKRKGGLPAGWFDVHKTNVNHDDSFADDAIDREGRWRLDERGNLAVR